MSMTNAGENALAALFFSNTNFASIGDATGLRGSSVAGNFYLTLHTADPGEAGDQTTNEATYTSYARVAVSRSTGFNVSGNSAALAALTEFPACTGGNNTITHFGIGTDSSGAGVLVFKAPLGSNLGPFTGATTDTITIPGLTGLSVDDRISFYPALGSSLPTGIAEGTLYWVKTVSGDAVTISATQGGATVDITASGDGVAFRNTPITASAGVTPRLTTSTTVTFD